VITKDYLLQLRQASVLELQTALERVQQQRGAIAIIDALLIEIDKGKDNGS
jgi:hypothetical protein